MELNCTSFSLLRQLGLNVTACQPDAPKDELCQQGLVCIRHYKLRQLTLFILGSITIIGKLDCCSVTFYDDWEANPGYSSDLFTIPLGVMDSVRGHYFTYAP